MKVMQRLLILASVFLVAASWSAPVSARNSNCSTLKGQIHKDKQRIRTIDTQLGTINRQLSEIERRRRQLEQRKAVLLRVRGETNSRLNMEQSRFQSSCGICTSLNRRAANLSAAINQTLDKIAAVAQRIRSISSEVHGLEVLLPQIRSEYQRLNCSYLIAGQTAQSTIDRCSNLFSRWNRIQAKINELRGTIRRLNRQYSMLMSRLESLENQLGNVYAGLQRSCTGNPGIANVRVLLKAGNKYRGLKTDLNNLGIRLKKAGGIRLKKMKPMLKRKKRRPRLKRRY